MADKHEDDANAAPRKTVFVRNLSFDTTSTQLEEAFSEFGPIKKAFVVKDQDNASKCRGFGYVQFVLQDDADNAAKSVKTINSRKVKICYANKKPKHQKRKEKQGKSADNDEDLDDVKLQEDKIVKENKIVKKSDSENHQVEKSVKSDKAKSGAHVQRITDRTDLQRTIVLTGLTSKVKRKAFRVMCEQFGEIENIVYPVPERSEVTAFIRFKEYKATIRAIQKIPGRKVKKSHALSAVLLTKEGKNPSKKMLGLSRLIVRNLNFKCDENDIRSSFSKFGKILEVSIPTKHVKNREIKIGCAFVQFENQAQAKAAVDALNMTEIKGRTVVVDWAVSKEKYEENKNTETISKVNKKKENLTSVNNNSETVKKDKDIENDNSKIPTDGGDADDDVTGDSDEEEDEEGEDEDEENKENGSEEDVSGDMEDSDDENKVTKVVKKSKDVKEGKTVFLRNLSYDTDEETVVSHFERFGEIEYCKIVYDQETGRSRGSAFVKFKEKISAEKCLEEPQNSEDGGTFRIDGRPLSVSLAVSQGKLGEIKRVQADNKKEKDKRNLYLAYEGVITKSSPRFESLSEADLKKREKALAEKKTKLKDPNYFVSTTRLCIRNLPLTTDANELRSALHKHASNEMKITDVKVMRSKDRKDQNGVPRSLGYAFVNVDTHEHALALLRATNNNPDVFTEKRRPIVEFSVESTKALKLLEQRKLKNQQKLTQNEQSSEEQNNGELEKTSTEKKKSQWEKRLVRYKKKREEKKKNNLTNKSNDVEQNNINFVNSAKNGGDNRLKRKHYDAPVENISNSESHTPVKRGRKVRQNHNAKEEQKFNSLVEQYKDKLSGSKIQKNKKKDSRWFE
ncbi:RNA-binding protein 28-like [Hydractinia symbiolongicarpus]|uniref:RNA-binding protein 28-like n=1 Tax=Hydractinia symbiolongicarpus TaxID=13093 RepID=UPI00254EED14|nr:RNA-binding protein 28-like [Hydractinia symbiolongicarpus]